MDTIIDFISENFIIVVIVIGGLLSLLKNKSISNNEENEETGNPNVANSTRSNYPDRRNERNNAVNATNRRTTSHASTSTVASIEEQQQEQMKQFEKRMGASSKPAVEQQDNKSHEGGLKHNLQSPEIVRPYHHDQFKKEIKGKLNQKGLIDSIVMAEVLGPPRAKKPYSSIITRKK